MDFKGKHFMKEIILMAVRWYLAYPLSYRDIEELLLERNIMVDHSTVNRWVVEYSPQLLAEFRRKKNPVGNSWKADETYVKIKGQWRYHYRAVDKEGKTIGVYLSKNRDKKAAKAFFKKSIRTPGLPKKITIDKSGANHSALKAINSQLNKEAQFLIRQITYLNNVVEQDHRFIKKVVNPMLGFKAFHSVDTTLQGIELHHMLRKGQHTAANEMSIPEQFYALTG